MTQVGQCSVKAHNLQQSGATPGPGTFDRVRKWQSGQVESLVYVGSTPTSVIEIGPVVQWKDACLASKRPGFDSR